MSTSHTETFLTKVSECLSGNHLVKLTLSNKRDKSGELKNVFVKPVQLKTGLHFSFVYRYPTKDITKNYTQTESISLLRGMIGIDFLKADLYSTTATFHLTILPGGKTQLLEKAHETAAAPDTSHDKAKKRMITSTDNIYLHELGVTTIEGKVKSDKQDKFRQINKYVEIVDSIIRSSDLPDSFTIADMGAGKGYLTFALYDYLTTVLHRTPVVTGVEQRPELVDKCNDIAGKAGFKGLSFATGSIEDAELGSIDMLIALHACDIATDQAIYQGIRAGAKVILCAPCCHKQIRSQLQPVNELKTITRHGILAERQAEILTDTIRSLILEAHGYSTTVFEFISTEHTPKNVMISAIKTKSAPQDTAKTLDQVKKLKESYGIKYHHLEKLLGL
jgi:hypothetical protein